MVAGKLLCYYILCFNFNCLSLPIKLTKLILCVLSRFSCVWLFVTTWTIACQALCPLLFHGVSSDSCPLSQWRYLTILSSAAPFSFCLLSFPRSGSFPVSQLLAAGGQSIGASASASYEYSGLISFRIDWFDLAVQGTPKNLLQHHNSKASILWHSAFLIV